MDPAGNSRAQDDSSSIIFRVYGLVRLLLATIDAQNRWIGKLDHSSVGNHQFNNFRHLRLDMAFSEIATPMHGLGGINNGWWLMADG